MLTPRFAVIVEIIVLFPIYLLITLILTVIYFIKDYAEFMENEIFNDTDEAQRNKINEASSSNARTGKKI